MRKSMLTLTLLALATALGCQSSSPRGGSGGSDSSFRIAAPAEVVLKQGETKAVTLNLTRGDYFKQDVKVDLRADRGVKADPTSVWVRASEKPEAVVRLSAAPGAAIGEYKVHVTGKPSSGDATTMDFKVKVVAP